ncbi:hypothetical protein N310_05139, partial [Acanthisitta chloris]
SGSLGLDLATSADVTLIDNRPQKIPTGVCGPTIINGETQGALLLGPSSSGLKGISVLPGVIDSDFEGEIYIVVQTSFPPIVIPRGSRIAQLVSLSQLTTSLTTSNQMVRGEGAFGSTGGLVRLSMPLNERPVTMVTLNNRGEQVIMQALLDTSADISIV